MTMQVEQLRCSNSYISFVTPKARFLLSIIIFCVHVTGNVGLTEQDFGRLKVQHGEKKNPCFYNTKMHELGSVVDLGSEVLTSVIEPP